MPNALPRGAFARLALAAVLAFAPAAAQARGHDHLADITAFILRPFDEFRSEAASKDASKDALLKLHPSLVARALQDLGRGNFTPFNEAWCADAVSAWLVAVGLKPLANHKAASALAYGPRVADPHPGDLVVIRTRRGPFGHVGIVVADLGRIVRIVSGNWGGRVREAEIDRRSVTAFVRA